mmetsp:Transcript_1560/g.3097  ORF Transcript_1560/g.3097 Transcript_1560/m.3097 type:complete len:202 (-) Transcript_1560:30-635(-)
MATYHRNVDIGHRRTCHLVDKFVGTNDVKGCNSQDLARVQALLLPELTHRRHHRIHWIDDQGNYCLGAKLSARLNDVLSNTSIDVQQIFAILARLARNTCWNQHQVTASEALTSLLNGLVGHIKGIASHLALCVQVGDVSSNSRSRHHGNCQVVDAQLFDVWVHRHQHAQRLANASSTAHHTDLEVSGHRADSTSGKGSTA